MTAETAALRKANKLRMIRSNILRYNWMPVLLDWATWWVIG